VDSINLAQGTIQWRVVLRTLMKNQLHKAEALFTPEQNMKAQRGVEV
jgi:hypothetical protein